MKRLILMALVLIVPVLEAQTVMLPTLQVCNVGKASGNGLVYLSRRDDGVTAGTFSVALNVGCDPQSSSPYPTGTVTMRFDMSETTAPLSVVSCRLSARDRCDRTAQTADH
jgi:hypothetical protein